MNWKRTGLVDGTESDRYDINYVKKILKISTA